MNSKKVPDVKIILYDSYLQAIKNSVGSNLFRNLYAHVDGKRKDVLKNGILSCATFVSSILYLHKLIADTHATVNGTVKDLHKSGWREITTPKKGTVLLWEAVKFKDGSFHKHIGFYVNNSKAISNNTRKHRPASHHWTFGVRSGKPVRKVEKIFWHKRLESKHG